MAPIRKKLVVVGDNACGKVALLITFSKGQFPEVCVPTVFENYVADIEVDKKKVTSYSITGLEIYNFYIRGRAKRGIMVYVHFRLSLHFGTHQGKKIMIDVDLYLIQILM